MSKTLFIHPLKPALREQASSRILARRAPLSCAWTKTGNPRQPLACVWIDHDLRIFTDSDQSTSSSETGDDVIPLMLALCA
jgi:hypothetical protein